MLLVRQGDEDWKLSDECSNVDDISDLDKRAFITVIKAKNLIRVDR